MNVFAPEPFWRFALMVVPLALLVALLCRCLPVRPATRHTLWLTLLMLLLVAPLLPQAPVPDLAAIATDEPTQRASETAPPSKGQTAREPGLRSVPKNAEAQIASAQPAPHARFIDDPPSTTRIEQRSRPESRSRPSIGRERDPRIFPFQRSLPARNAPIGRSRSESARPPASAVDSANEPHRQGTTSEAASASIEPAHDRRAGAASATNEPDETNEAATFNAHQPRPSAAARETDASEWSNWLIALRTVRDTVMSLPPIPTLIWGGGACLLLLLMVLRAVFFRRLVRAASPADPETLAYVNEAADDLALRRRPEVMMVDARISPMVSCGRGVRLLLPRRLWGQLDDVGRRAVIYHELAHLKRRDHWVCWLALIAGCLYWWHPVVWWIRRQLREEADLCCDVWVTTLLPASRRAYATALLETKRFTSAPQPAEPLVALGVMRTDAKRFARRLRMVMSHQLTPKMTLGGAALACLLAAGTWLSTPTLACPPDDKDATCDKNSNTGDPVVKVVSAPDAREKSERSKKNAGKAKQKQAKTAITDLVKSFSVDADECDELTIEQRVQRVEEKLAHLMSLVGDFDQLQGQLAFSAPALESLQAELGDFPAVPDDVLAAVEPLLSQAGDAAETYKSALEAYNVALGTRGGLAGLAQVAPTQNQNPMIVRKYKLPEGKLAAITELMVRSDVPVLVRPGDEAIEVHGTPDQHRIFKAFCTMIDGKDRSVEYDLPKGKLDALTELMVRSDVPILVSPGDDHIEVHGTDLEQAVFDAFVKMISGKTAPPIAGGVTDVPRRAPDARRMLVDAPLARDSVTDKARAYEAQARARVAQMNALRQKMKNLDRQLERLEKQREQMERKAEAVEDQADEIEDRAREIEEQARDLEGQQRVQAVRRMNELVVQAARLESEARLLEAQAEAIEAQAEAIEAQMDELSEKLEELEEQDTDEDEEDERDEH